MIDQHTYYTHLYKIDWNQVVRRLQTFLLQHTNRSQHRHFRTTPHTHNERHISLRTQAHNYVCLATLTRPSSKYVAAASSKRVNSATYSPIYGTHGAAAYTHTCIFALLLIIIYQTKKTYAFNTITEFFTIFHIQRHFSSQIFICFSSIITQQLNNKNINFSSSFGK